MHVRHGHDHDDHHDDDHDFLVLVLVLVIVQLHPVYDHDEHHLQPAAPAGAPGGSEKKSTSPAAKNTKAKKPHKKKHKGKGKSSRPTTSHKKTTGLRNNGARDAIDPTYTLALPGAAPLGVPNFFIDSFQIPPFLLPIYQAAGIEYDVPWQVLASINQIETDYGRNLSVSSAGAVGWMQFLPSTWKEWAVDATGSGYADPYNPVDAIFTAARYLQAAGAAKNLSKAIFAYNHAGWYVQSVLLRAKLIGGMPNQLIGALTGLVEGRFPVAAGRRTPTTASSGSRPAGSIRRTLRSRSTRVRRRRRRSSPSRARR